MRKIIPVILVLAFALIGSNIVYATPQTRVYTTDSANNPTLKFWKGQTVYIHWDDDTEQGPCHIIVYFGGPRGVGTLVHQWWGLATHSGVSPILWDTSSDNLGVYYIELNDVVTITLALSSILLVPELPIGTVMATVAAFGALGSAKLKRRKYNKI